MIILICAGKLIYDNIQKNSSFVATYGGSYNEGIISNSLDDVKPTITALTKIGLVAFDKDKNIIPSLAFEWKISDDQKTYTFKIRDFAKASDVAQTLKQEKTDWADIEIKTLDDSTLELVLKQPFSPLLDNLTEPLFNYGPYQIKKQSNSEIVFESKKDFYLGQPFISEIKLKFYPNEENLLKVLKNRQIDGIADYQDQIGELPSDWQILTLKLPRQIMLFFNLKREVLQDKNVRKKLASGQKLDKPINLTLVTNSNQDYLKYAEEIKTRWLELGATVDIQIKSNSDLQKINIPSRDFDVLIYGLDYGRDPDPYPFWHSSQVTNTGLNLSSFSNIDADKLLEEARLTNNQENRTKKYEVFQKILDDQTPAVILEQVTWQLAIDNKVKGITEHQAISSSDRFFEVWKWYVRTQRVRK